MHCRLKTFFTLLPLLSLLSCTISPTPGTQPPVASPTVTLIPESTSPPASSTPFLPTGTSIPLPPTKTPAPIPPTSTSAPSSLNPSGPYVLYKSESGIWISNPDGSFLTQLTALHARGYLRSILSPQGNRLAFVVRTELGLDLVMVNIPSGETQTITNLITIPSNEEIFNPTSEKSLALYAIRDYDGVAWQPGTGRLLAFTGAIDGPSSDLYTYDTETGEITRLTSGLSQSVMTEWSPDGQYILNFGVSWVPPFGGAIIGPNHLDGVWAVRVSDGDVISLPKPKGTHPNFVGWLDDSHYITYDSDEECDSINLRTVEIPVGKVSPLMEASFYSFIAQSSRNGALLISGAPGCASALGEGVFLLKPGEPSPVKVLEKRAWGIDWMPESQLFFAYPEALLSADATVRYDPPVYDASYHPAVSSSGWQAWQVIQNRVGRVDVNLGSGKWQTILKGFVDGLLWDPVQGQTMLIAMEDGSLYAATYPDFSPVLSGNLGKNVSEMIWMP